MTSLREFTSVCGAYQYAEERASKSRDEASFWRIAASLYLHWLGEALSAERAVENAHQGYGILTELKTFA